MPPPILGREATLAQALEPPGEGAEAVLRDFYANAAGLRELHAGDPDARRVIDTARGLEGLRRQDSIHAAAVVICPQPITEIVPIQQKGEGAEVVTQFEMHAIEELGLLKMDFLGLRNLSTIERALELIEENTGSRPDIDRVAPRRPGGLRHALARGRHRHLPAGRGRHAGADAQPAPRPLRGHHRPGLPVPARPSRRRHPQPLRRPQERAGGGRVPPSRPRRRCSPRRTGSWCTRSR